jgi:hypothetical protein
MISTSKLWLPIIFIIICSMGCSISANADGLNESDCRYRYFESMEQFIPVYSEHLTARVSPSDPAQITSYIDDPDTELIQILVTGPESTRFVLRAEVDGMTMEDNFSPEEEPVYPLYLLVPLEADTKMANITILSTRGSGTADIDIQYVYDSMFAYGSLCPGEYAVWLTYLPEDLDNAEFSVLVRDNVDQVPMTGIYVQPGRELPRRLEDFLYCSAGSDVYSWITVDNPARGPWLIMVATDLGSPVVSFASWWTGIMADEKNGREKVPDSGKEKIGDELIPKSTCNVTYPNMTFPLTWDGLCLHTDCESNYQLAENGMSPDEIWGIPYSSGS